MNIQKLFRSLVRSALDFAEKSLQELKKGDPKYSLIHFCTALELFLKARLMLEHWTLVVTNPARAIPQSFEQGQFHSVSLEETLQRLENVAGQKFLPREKQIFERIRGQRNRLVHFLDPTSEKAKALEKAAAEECNGWYYLHRLLTETWKKEFKSFRREIEQLGAHLHQIRAFLKAKYEAIHPVLATEKSKGIKHRLCWSCSFKAYRATNEEVSPAGSKLFTAGCLVCEAQGHFLELDCPDCGRKVWIDDLGEGQCQKCGFEADANWLVETLGPYQDPKEESETAYCTDCERADLKTVVPTNDAGYICLSCFSRFETIGFCGYCGTPNAGRVDPVDSYLAGCVLCAGMVAQDSS